MPVRKAKGESQVSVLLGPLLPKEDSWVALYKNCLWLLVGMSVLVIHDKHQVGLEVCFD